ncbi:hypothetical protein [Proteus terrae]|uniref:tail fiber/spike domain-containing protein n=1 Tax=Proteus terrae TaxID=1574161 RepID=UPI0034D65594
MTVSTELSHEEYVGNGVTTDFDFRFRIFESRHLIVVVADNDGNETTLKNGTDYTIVGAGSYHGGKVVLNKPLARGWTILLERDLPVVQETDLRNQGKFFAEVHEDAFDYLTMLIQKALGTFSLSLRKPTYLSNYYDAKGNRIANLASPKVGTDAANKDYVDNSIKYIDSKTLRVKDKAIPALPSAEQRRNKQLGFDNEGYPQLLDPAETGSLGYVLVDSFEKGAEITTRYQALHFENNGEYYRWDGDLPKSVPVNSSPVNSGGVGVGKWISVGDASLRGELGVITKKYNSAMEMISDVNIKKGVTVRTHGYHSINDGGSAEYYIEEDNSYDGFFNLRTANGYTAVCQSPISLRLCGAVGDYDINTGTGTDDSDAIEFFFSKLESYTGALNGFAKEIEAERLYAKTMTIEKGNYLLTRKIVRGVDGEIISQQIKSEVGAFIHAVIPAVSRESYAIELHQLRKCKIDLNVRSKNCGALLTDTAFNCDINYNAGSNKCESTVRYQGVIFNCALNHRLNQNVAFSSIGSDPDAYMILGDFTKTTYTDWSGMVISNFENTFAAGGGKGIKLKGGNRIQGVGTGPVSQVRFGILELEGTNGIALDIENFNNLSISSQWSEATGGSNTENVLRFKNGDGLVLQNIKTGEIRDNISIENVNAVIADNFEGGGGFYLKGDINGLIINNPRMKATKWRDFINPIDNSLYNLKGLKLVNPMMIEGNGLFKSLGNSVNSGFSQSIESNLILSPDLTTGIKGNYCSVSESDITPAFGNVSKKLTTGGSRFPSVTVDLKETKYSNKCYVLMALKPTSLDGSERVINAGINVSGSNGISNALDGQYGKYTIYQDGWLYSISTFDLSAGNSNKIDIVWNYNKTYQEPKEFILGGVAVFSGTDISLPN